MNIDIEKIIEDEEIKKILYLLETIERGGSKGTALNAIHSIPTTQENGTKPSPREIIRVLVGDYESGTIELDELKNEIFSTLQEYGVLKKAV